jgi:phage terminase large subunit-like protein
VRDLFSVVAVFEAQGKWKVLHWSWIGKESATERVKADNVPYDRWIKAGQLKTTEGVDTKFDPVKDFIVEYLDTRFRVNKVVMDRAQGGQLSQQLEDEGISVELYPQNFLSMSYPMKMIERWILSRNIEHRGKEDPVLRWCMGNTVAERDKHENLFPSKKKSQERIDACVAMIMAFGAAFNDEGYAAPMKAISVEPTNKGQ